MKKLIIFGILGWLFLYQASGRQAMIVGPFSTKEECVSVAWELHESNKGWAITTRCWLSSSPEVHTQILPRGD